MKLAMNNVIFPLNLRMNSPAVGDLQDALRLLLDRGVILANDEGARRELTAVLLRERADQTYGSGTRKLVNAFQEERQLQGGGAVDEATAEALNVLLHELGALPEIPVAEAGSNELSLGKSGTRVGEVQTGLGQLAYSIPQQEAAEAVFGPGTQSAIRRFQDAMGLTVSGRADARTLSELDRALAEQGGVLWRVEGRLFHEHGGPAVGVKLRLQQSLFGGKTQRLTGQEITTDALGYYSATYAPTTEKVLLTVLAVGADGQEVALSQPVLARRREVLNLVLPAKLQPASAAEFQRLAAALQPHLGTGRLALAREDGDQHDLSLLHQATGWDARVLALAAHADSLAAEPELTAAGLGGEALYALVRAGLPTDAGRLAIESEETVEAALKQASAAGIVRLAEGDIATAKQAFRKFADQKRLSLLAPGALSTTGDMLQAAGLAEAAKNGFTRAYARHLRSGADLWAEARREGVPEPQIAKLQVQGKLAYLTQNHQPLVEQLMARVPSLSPGDLSGLVDQDFHEAGTWQRLFTEVAGVTGRENAEELELKLAKVRPPAFEAPSAREAVAAASDDFARQLRLSYPTQVARRVVEKDANDNNRLGLRIAGGTQVHEVLSRAMSMEGGFELGHKSVDGFIKRNKAALFPDETDAEIAAATKGLRTLQRVYQIAPTVEAMGSLLSLGFKSARDVTRFSKADFVRAHTHRLAGPEEAALIYDKATQVSVVTFNFFALAQQAQSGLATGATHSQLNNADGSGAAENPDERNSVMKNLITQFPTLETLLGEQDYAECQGCESVLSPSAYFVDLLEFLNPDDLVWTNFLAEWKHTHLDVPYGRPKPFDVLMQRRPDLQHLPLTCENTETVLPYIDVVNEILEYSVANGTLDPKAAHDTGQARSDELIAEPQNLLPAAYDNDHLKGAHYPLSLPFDLWLETVRRFFKHQGTTLAEAMDALCPTESLHDNGASFDRAAVAVESLGLSPGEAGLLTDPAIHNEWFKLYGYDIEPEAVAALIHRNGKSVPNAKLLSRRLGVTYKELAGLVQTEFLNPALKPAGFLHRLGLEFNDLRRLTRTPLDDDEQDAEALRLENEEWQHRIDATATELGLVPAAVQAQVAQARAALDLGKILVLSDSDTNASFDQTMLRFADAAGTPVTHLALLKLNLFVRLWRKLGWSLEDTDRALCLFCGDPATINNNATLGAAMRTALLYLARTKHLLGTLPLGAKGLPKLLTFWTELPKSLYARHFLNRAVLRTDPAFDHPLGQYLSAANVDLNKHLPALEGALGLATDDIARVLAHAAGQPPQEAGTALANAKLTMTNVSVLYRHATLAKALKLSISELIALKEISGVNPFGSLKTSAALQELSDDGITAQTLRFLDLATTLRELGVKLAGVDALLRHRYADDSKDKPTDEIALKLTQKLAEALRQIEAEHTPPETVDAAWLAPRLSMILPPDQAGELAAWCLGNAQVEVTTGGNKVEPKDEIPPSTFAGEANLGLRYSSVAKRQTLTWRGYLTASKAAELKAMIPQGNAATVLADLINNLREAQKSAFAACIDLSAEVLAAKGANLSRESLAVAAIAMLAQSVKPDADAPSVAQELKAKLALGAPIPLSGDAASKLARVFLPVVIAQAQREYLDKSMSEELHAAPGLTQRLLDGDMENWRKQLLKPGTQAALLKTAGLPPQAAFNGWFLVPTSGAYRLMIEGLALDEDGAITINGKTCYDKNPGDAEANLSDVVMLKAGDFVACKINGTPDNPGNRVQVTIQGETLRVGALARLTLLSRDCVDAVRNTRLALAKALRILQASGVDDALLAANPVLQNWLRKLPLESNAANDALAPELLNQWRDLITLAQLPATLGMDQPTVIAIQAVNALDQKTASLIAPFFGCDAEKVLLLAAKLGISAPLDAQTLLRLWKALRMVALLGGQDSTQLDGSLEDVLQWVTPTPSSDIARAVRDAVKARCDLDDWPQVAQPIFDPLRQLQRDALVAFLLHRENLQRMEQLYEVFLLDPGTEPVVQTSRMALAIAGVQLFIQRCFLNLEPEVHPTTLDAGLWKWMKSIALWGAGRRIFIHPENYLQPEFRDDKSHLFQELEGKLLQGNVTTDLAEEAFHSYLQGLAEISKMEMVTMHCEQHSDPRKNVVHLIGRVPNAAQKYFYRRSAHGAWTPWEPVSVSMEGDHITAIVWRGRLQLFWLTFLPAGGQSEEAKNTTFEGMRNQQPSALIQHKEKVQLNWSEYYQGKWSARKFGQGDAATLEFNVSAEFKRSQIFIHASKESDGKGGDGAVWVNLRVVDSWSATTAYSVMRKSKADGPTDDLDLRKFPELHLPPDFLVKALSVTNHGFKLISKLCPPVGTWSGAPGLPASPYAAGLGNHPTKLTGAGSLAVTFNDTIVTTSGVVTSGAAFPHHLLGAPTGFQLLTSTHPAPFPDAEIAVLTAPFFYEDAEAVFFVEPTLVEKTVSEWQGWGHPWIPPTTFLGGGSVLLPSRLIAHHPEKRIVPEPLFDPLGPVAGQAVTPQTDWVTHPAASISFNGQNVGRTGSLSSSPIASGVRR